MERPEKEILTYHIRKRILQEITGAELLALGAGSIAALWIYKFVSDMYDVKVIETALSEECYEASYMSANIIFNEDFEEGIKEKIKHFIKSFLSGKNRSFRHLVKSGYIDLITRRAVAEYLIKQNPKSPISKALKSGTKIVEVKPSQFLNMYKSFIPMKYRLLKIVPEEFNECDEIAFKYTLIVFDALSKIIKEHQDKISKIILSFEKVK